MSENKNAKNRKKTLRLIAFCGITAAFVFLGTQLRIPTAIGYINLGDAVILIASYIIGPAAFFPAAIGSVLSSAIGQLLLSPLIVATNASESPSSCVKV